MKDKELQDYDDYNSDEEEGLAADLVQRRKNIEARY